MKFAIFAIVALCAVVAQGSKSSDHYNKIDDYSVGTLGARDGLIDGLLEFVEKVKEEFKRIFDDLREKSENIVDGIKKQIKELEDKTRTIISNALEDLKQLLGKMAAAGDIPKKCVEKHQDEIDAISKSAQTQLENCVSDAIGKGQGILKNMQEHIDGVQDNLEKMNEVVEECRESTESFVQLAWCVTKKTKEIQKEVFGIFKHAAEAMVNASKQSVSIVAGGQVCVAKVVVDVNKQIFNVTASVNKCILNGGQ